MIVSGDHEWQASAEGNGAIDALYKAVDEAVAGVLSGLSMSFCNVCLQSLVGLLSTPENRARNFSNYSLARWRAAGATAFHVGLAAPSRRDHLARLTWFGQEVLAGA